MKALRVAALGLALALALLGAGAGPAPKVYPVVSARGGFLLGAATEQGKWLPAAAAAQLLAGGEEYGLYSLAGKAGSTTGNKPKPDPDGICGFVLTLKSVPSGGNELVGISAPWEPMPRPPRVLDRVTSAQQEGIGNILRERGLRDYKVNVTQSVAVDLDGDGAEESLLSAIAPAAAGGGPVVYYSLAVVRKVMVGEVRTIVLDGDFFGPAVSAQGHGRFRIIGALDLNNDGVEEVIVSSSKPEGEALAVYAIKDGAAVKVLEAGCGKK
jgi:hypothetical protein